jgi:cytochrome P450
MSTADVERHERLRRIAHRALTPRRMFDMEPRIYGYINDLLEPARRARGIGLAEFWYRLPLMIIATILGVPHSDHKLVHEWTAKLARRTWPDPGSVSGLAAAMLDAQQDERATPEELPASAVEELLRS